MLRKITAIFSIIIGASMIGMWTMFYVTGGIPELATEPARIITHIAAEILTGMFLIIGGLGLFKLKRWGFDIYVLATGALIYTLIQSPGYYINLGEMNFVIMFAVMLILAIIFLLLALSRREEYSRKNYYM